MSGERDERSHETFIIDRKQQTLTCVSRSEMGIYGAARDEGDLASPRGLYMPETANHMQRPIHGAGAHCERNHAAQLLATTYTAIAK